MAGGDRDRHGARIQGAAPDGERRPGLRALGIAAGRIAAPIVARRGGGVVARLKSEWTAVAGAEFAAIAWPEAITRDHALKLRVAPGFALELQHRAPLLIERINLFFGHEAVARLVLIQGRLMPASTPRPAPPPPLAAAEAEALAARLADVADPELRAALAGLGQLVLARSPRSK